MVRCMWVRLNRFLMILYCKSYLEIVHFVEAVFEIDFSCSCAIPKKRVNPACFGFDKTFMVKDLPSFLSWCNVIEVITLPHWIKRQCRHELKQTTIFFPSHFSDILWIHTAQKNWVSSSVSNWQFRREIQRLWPYQHWTLVATSTRGVCQRTRAFNKSKMTCEEASTLVHSRGKRI